MPEATVVATAPEFEMLTTGVPVIVKLVTVAVVQRVPPAVMQVMLPDPNAIVLAFAFDELKRPHVSAYPPRSRVPAVSVYVPPIAQFDPSVSVPLVCVMLKV